MALKHPPSGGTLEILFLVPLAALNNYILGFGPSGKLFPAEQTQTWWWHLLSCHL